MTDERWDDERLRAAFADRFDRPAPRELTSAVLERVRETAPRPTWWPTLERPSTVRLVSGLAVVAILAVLVLPRSSGPGPSVPAPSAPGASAVTGAPSGSAAPGVAGFSATAAGLAVRSVADAGRLVAVPTTLDTELAVAGWYSARDLALPCPYQVPTSPVAFRCEDVAAWLSGTDRPLLSADGSPAASADTGGTLDLRFIDPVAPPPGGQGPRQAMVTTPVPVIVVGHFHDERSARCTTAEMADCQRTFVVDTVAGSDGSFADPSATPPRGCPPGARCAPRPFWSLTSAQVAELARTRVGSTGVILSLGRETGLDAPWFMEQATQGCICPATWFVRGYSLLPSGTNDPRPVGTPVAGWLLVDDKTGSVSGPLRSDAPQTATAPPLPGFPTSVEGLPVLSVLDAISRDAVDDRPVAVAGWLTQTPIHPCPSGADLDICERDTVILDGTAERLLSLDGGGFATTVPANGPVLYPAILEGSPVMPVPNRDGSPHRAVLIVHRGDPRADRDGAGRPVAAQDYVLDQVAWLDGKDQPAAIHIEPGIKPTLTPETALVIAGSSRTSTGRTWTISISAVRANDLATIGSTATTDVAGIVWLIRLTGRNPLDPNSGPNGWGTILVEETTGQFSTDWTNGP